MNIKTTVGSIAILLAIIVGIIFVIAIIAGIYGIVAYVVVKAAKLAWGG